MSNVIEFKQRVDIMFCGNCESEYFYITTDSVAICIDCGIGVIIKSSSAPQRED